MLTFLTNSMLSSYARLESDTSGILGLPGESCAALCVALIIAVLSFAGVLVQTKSQQYTEVGNNRVQWLDEFRNELGSFLSGVSLFVEAVNRGDTEAYVALRETIRRSESLVTLRISPERALLGNNKEADCRQNNCEQRECPIRECIENSDITKMTDTTAEEKLVICMHELTRKIGIKDKNPEKIEHDTAKYKDFLACYRTITDMGRIIQKQEWEKAKEEIRKWHQ